MCCSVVGRRPLGAVARLVLALLGSRPGPAVSARHPFIAARGTLLLIVAYSYCVWKQRRAEARVARLGEMVKHNDQVLKLQEAQDQREGRYADAALAQVLRVP